MKRQKTNTGLFRQVALIVCLFAGLFSGWSAAAQQSGVHGQVTDRKTGQPVVGATVRVEGTTIATSSRFWTSSASATSTAVGCAWYSTVRLS